MVNVLGFVHEILGKKKNSPSLHLLSVNIYNVYVGGGSSMSRDVLVIN